MVGAPKHCNTRDDWFELVDNFPEATWRPRIQKLYDERMNWIATAKLTAEEEGVTDATHRVTEIKDMITDEVTERYQEEYMLDPGCALMRCNLTVAEVEGWLE